MYLICRDLLSWHPIYISTYKFGIIRFLITFTSFLTITLILSWIYFHNKHVKSRHTTESILFPHFNRLFYIISFIDLLTIFILLILEVILSSNHSSSSSLSSLSLLEAFSMIFYCLCAALQHTFTEGIAYLLIQKGCGYYAFQKTRNFAIIWLIFTFFCYFFLYSSHVVMNVIGWIMWCGIVALYYLLWLLPSKYLFRRSAARPFAKYWAIYKTILLLSFALLYLHSSLHHVTYGYCGVYVIGFFGYALLHPLLIYRTLLDDSRWWQGIMDPPTPHGSRQSSGTPHGGEHGTTSATDMRTPLIGADLSLIAAMNLADAVDKMGGGNSTIQILNFAHIHLTSQRKLLGQGSFSKVYRGVYQREPCAVKLIFTTDLTEEVISRVTAEATLLSMVHSPNIVRIIGVSVLPPSVCMVLELCAYGSLSDVLRGSDNGRVPFHLSERDQLFLALGCARGVAALHSLNTQIVHRDIKSFNFLVDAQFNAKLADLELGVPTFDDNSSSGYGGPTVDDFLVNWIAPEVLRGEKFSQASDIYSLALVFHEILTRLIPYDDLPALRETTRATIKELVIKGYRPPLSSSLFSMSHFFSVIERGWSPYPTHRPTAAEIVLELEDIYFYLIPSLNPLLQTEVKIAHSLTHYYHKVSKTRANSQLLAPSLSFPSGQYLSRPSLMTAQPMTIFSLRPDNSQTIEQKTPELSSELYNTLPDIFEHMIIETSPWNDVFHSQESLLIISCCAPHVILFSSKTFLTNILKVPSNHQTPLLRTLFGTLLQSLTSSTHPLVTTAQPPSQKSNPQIPAMFQQFYSTVLTRGSGQLVTSFYDITGQPHLCLLHGYPIYNHDDTAPFDLSLFRPTHLSDRSSSDQPLSSISLSTSQYSTTDPTLPQPPKPNFTIPKLQSNLKDIHRSREILYMAVAVSSLVLMKETIPLAHTSGSVHDSLSNPSSGTGRHSIHSSPRHKRIGSDGILSQNIFLLDDPEGTLSVYGDVEEGLFVRDDPYEGASEVPERNPSSTSLSYCLDDASSHHNHTRDRDRDRDRERDREEMSRNPSIGGSQTHRLTSQSQGDVAEEFLVDL